MANTVTVRRSRDARPVLLFLVSLTIAAIIGQTWWAVLQDRRLTRESENKNGIVAVRALEENATQTFQETERAIDAVARTIADATDTIVTDDVIMRELINQQRSERRNLFSLHFVNLKGMSWLQSSQYPDNKVDVGERQYVRALLTHPEQRLSIIGHPLRSRYNNQWIVPIARNIYDRHGQHLGLIAGSIQVSYFGGFYKRVANNRNAVVSMHSDEGFVIVRSPSDDRFIDKNITQSPILRQIKEGPSEGSFEDNSFLDDQKSRLYSYRRSTVFPLTIVYGRDMDYVLAPWKSRSEQRILFAAATIAIIGILAFFLLLHIRRFHESEESLTASESRYRMLYESANDGILLINRDHYYVDCNPAAVRLFAVSGRDDIIGKKVGDFSPETQPSDDPRLDKTRLIDAAFAGQPQLFEWATLRNGKLHYNEITLSRAYVDNQVLLLGIYRDISARKYAEALHEGQNLILHLIGTGGDLSDILKEIILFIEQRAPHGRCMVLLLSEDQSHFTAGVAPSLPPPLLVSLIGMQIRAGDGSFSETVLTKCPVMVEDMSHDPLMHDLRTRVAITGFGACGSWPIMGKRGQILGIFSMLYRTQGAPSADDMQLVGISTDLASIAIESRRAEERIRHLAHYDELTGLPNRFLYTQHLDKALAHADRNRTLIAVLFLDLDRFKNINDTFGHDAGDTVLRDVSLRFTSALRDSDTIARVGGDEFIVLVDNYQDPIHLGEIAQRLLQEASKPFEIDGEECQLSVSIGIATYPVDGTDGQALLKNADIAMYRAKSTGKNNYQFYSSEMNTHTIDRLTLETRLRRAIERREFVMHYQPKIDVQSGRIVGAEALVRWKHPERGLLYPIEFIALAEEVGLIGALGMLVLDITCADITEFTSAGISFGRVAINLSGSQFNEINLLHDVMSVVDSWNVDPNSLEFEITESMVMHNRNQAISLMDGIRALGFSLSIDDFGTGYSSLAYLKRFPVDSVKIDKSFINDIPQDPNDTAIVQAIVAMAHTLGLKVTAEGVETVTQLETLRQFGCDEYQGFHFSRAIPGKDFIALVHSQSLLPTT